MRQPTDRAQLYAWHRQAVAALRELGVETLKEAAAIDYSMLPQLSEDEPRCGWYEVVMAQGAAPVGARVFLEQKINRDGELVDDERLRCEVAGEFVDPIQAWLQICDRPISQARFAYLEDVRMWAKTTAKAAPENRPWKPVDYLTVPLPTFKRTRK